MKSFCEPTNEQCNSKASIEGFGSQKAFACYYPQMNGYHGKCIVVIGSEDCFDVFVWHDGEFPMNGESPTYIHHCCPEQFIQFGQMVKSLQEQGK